MMPYENGFNVVKARFENAILRIQEAEDRLVRAQMRENNDPAQFVQNQAHLFIRRSSLYMMLATLAQNRAEEAEARANRAEDRVKRLEESNS